MKYFEVKIEDIDSEMNVKLDNMKNTVPYSYFFEKEDGKVYRYSKTANEDWRKDEMPFNYLPFSHYQPN